MDINNIIANNISLNIIFPIIFFIVFFLDSGFRFYENTYKRDFLVTVSAFGDVYWEYGGVVLTNCDINMNDYPFDSQTCEVHVETWRYDDTLMTLIPFNTYVLSPAMNNALWNLTNYQVTQFLNLYNFNILMSTCVHPHKAVWLTNLAMDFALVRIYHVYGRSWVEKCWQRNRDQFPIEKWLFFKILNL